MMYKLIVLLNVISAVLNFVVGSVNPMDVHFVTGILNIFVAIIFMILTLSEEDW
jgi:hypothetical protein